MAVFNRRQLVRQLNSFIYSTRSGPLGQIQFDSADNNAAHEMLHVVNKAVRVIYNWQDLPLRLRADKSFLKKAADALAELKMEMEYHWAMDESDSIAA